MKKPKKTGPTTVVISREVADAIDAYCQAHPLRPRRKQIVSVAVQQYIQNEEKLAKQKGDA